MNTHRLKRILKIPLQLSLLLLLSCSSLAHFQKADQKADQYHITSLYPDDSAMKAEIAPYKDSLDGMMNEVLGYSETAMTKQKPEGLLNNFTADMLFDYVNERIKPVDVALLNYGGLRSDLPKGNITRRNIYELMPFENEVVILKLKPQAFRQLLDYIAVAGGLPLSGMQMEIRGKEAVNVTIDGRPYDSTKTYTVVTSDYLANGGDNMEFLKNEERTELNIKLRDLFIDYIVKKSAKEQTLKARLDGRIKILE